MEIYIISASIMNISIGIKNKIKRDDKGWFVKFSRPVSDISKAGKTLRTYEPPRVVDAEGKPIEGFLNNGAIGEIKIDFKEGSTTMGKYYTARLEAVKLHEYKLWEADGSKPNAEVAKPKQENYF